MIPTETPGGDIIRAMRRRSEKRERWVEPKHDEATAVVVVFGVLLVAAFLAGVVFGPAVIAILGGG